jgi:hypothetical protein
MVRNGMILNVLVEVSTFVNDIRETQLKQEFLGSAVAEVRIVYAMAFS